MLNIRYLNKDKNHAEDKIEFEGPGALEKAIKWGKENLDRFDMDMINDDRP
ncbi:MAG TPA: hypothetical protein VFD35_09560 [Pricia sp.]|nr:hypothetical protein [Pricia sp.]